MRDLLSLTANRTGRKTETAPGLIAMDEASCRAVTIRRHIHITNHSRPVFEGIHVTCCLPDHLSHLSPSTGQTYASKGGAGVMNDEICNIPLNA